MNINTNLHFSKTIIYDKCGFDFSELKIEKESVAYEACTFKLNEKSIIYRTAKITPKKVGQFVTIWKRNKLGITIPFSTNDKFDFMVIGTKANDHFGQFIFPKSALLENAIISSDFKEGKRGMRVYPPWDITLNKQAIKTQKWQSKYFIEIFDETNIDLAKKLFK